jgi:hypothetical protein
MTMACTRRSEGWVRAVHAVVGEAVQLVSAHVLTAPEVARMWCHAACTSSTFSVHVQCCRPGRLWGMHPSHMAL